MINPQLVSRYALPPLFIVALSAAGALAKIRRAYIDDPWFRRAQVATGKAFMNIKQQNFSTTPKMSFTGLKASFYHVRTRTAWKGKPGSMTATITRPPHRRVEP